jgi:hypothetical protein
VEDVLDGMESIETRDVVVETGEMERSLSAQETIWGGGMIDKEGKRTNSATSDYITFT